MAINLHKMFADALLELCETKPLKSITVKQLLEYTGASKQAFYNRFLDRADLIIWIYTNYVLNSFSSVNLNKTYYECAVDYYKRIEKYHKFMKQACTIQGQNCLKDYMVGYSIAFDLNWLKNQRGEDTLPEEIEFASRYNSIANIGIAIEWIMEDMPKPPEFIAYQTSLMKTLSVGNQVFEDGYKHFDGLKND